MSVTLKDIANQLGVSKTLIAGVLKDTPGVRANPATRQRILTTAREMGYQVNVVARAMATGRTNIVGVVDPNYLGGMMRNPFVVGIIDGIVEAAASYGLNVMLITSNNPANADSGNVTASAYGHCDGLILMPRNRTTPVFKGDLPAVQVLDTGDDLPIVDIDHRVAARSAVEHLQILGHHRIAMIQGEVQPLHSVDRLHGYRDALAHRGNAGSERVLVGSYIGTVPEDDIRALMSLEPGDRPTAFFCGNDAIALRLIRFLQEIGLSVPGDISVIGFDDIPTAELSHPGLTTVHQPLFDIGKRATEIIVERLATADREPFKEYLATSIVVRGSTAPPRFA